MLFNHFNETAHMGAFEMMREFYRNGNAGYGFLFHLGSVEHDDRIAKVSNADPLNGNIAVIRPAFGCLSR